MHRLDPFGAMEEIDEVRLPVSTIVHSIRRRSESKSSQYLAEYLSHKVPICPKIYDVFCRLFVSRLVRRLVSLVVLRLSPWCRCFSVLSLVLVPGLVPRLVLVLLTGTGTGGRAIATNLGFFPRLGLRAERISRATILALPPLHAGDSFSSA